MMKSKNSSSTLGQFGWQCFWGRQLSVED